ncbi:MAG: class I SAM-dependent methyltransferase [Rhizobacter sp.]|nr:class I SAM-dependent methyltransferase [Rhizobacter sp.]
MTADDERISDYWSSKDSIKVQRYLTNAERYDRVSPEAVEDARFLDLFVAPRYAGRSVLDFGAGPGRLVPLWARHGAKLTCAEWSDAFLPNLKSRVEKFGGRAEKLDITRQHLPETFDLVFSTQVLLHIHPRHIDAAIANVRRMAKGDILLITWQSDNPFDTVDSPKVQSFNHDYLSLFAKHGCRLNLEMGLTFGATRGRGAVTNKIYLLAAAPPAPPASPLA